jgi:hypothetical protein
VTKDRNQLKNMLKYSQGSRKVPIIVDGQKVFVGFEGKG